MIGKANRKEKQKLTSVVDMLSSEMITYGPDSEEFPVMLERMERVDKVRRTSSPLKSVTPEVWLPVIGNVLIVLVVVAYEQKHVITTSALKFLSKGKSGI